PRWLRRDRMFGDLGGVLPCSMLAHRWVFDRVGTFRESRAGADDLDWLFRARRAQIGIEIVPEILMRRRIHAGNTSNDFRTLEAIVMQSLRDLTRDQTRDQRPSG